MTRSAHRHPVNQAMHDNASPTQRAVDGFVAYFGSLRFIGWMTVVIIAWLVVNSLWLTAGVRWDPYPFILLNLAFSAQATYAAPLILLSQNRGAERDRLKAEHDYETNETALAEIRADRALTTEVHQLTKAVHAAVLGGQPIEGNTRMTRNALRAGGSARGIPMLATGAATYLADISEFQPDIADAAYLKWSKAIAIRAMYGAEHDDAAWYGGQRRADLHAGGAEFLIIYQYLVAGQTGAAQARAFHALVGPIRPGEVFVADYEEGAKQTLTDWYNTMLELYGAGIHPFLWTYTGDDFGQAAGVLPVEWIAEYGAAEPATPHRLWQFTDAYPVPGVGTCDASVYHGTIGELAALAYQPSAPKPSPAPAPSAPEWPAGASLQYGSSGGAVKALQSALNYAGLYGARGLTVDGEFGDQTQTGVRNYEADEGLTVDSGIAGPQVRAKLIANGHLTSAGAPVA